MNSFKYFLIEQSSRLLPNQKFWFKSGGGFIPLEDSKDHHIKKVVDEPHKFDINLQDIKNMKPRNTVEQIKNGITWDDNIIKSMNDKGHFRGHYSHIPAHMFHDELIPTEHNFEISDDRAWTDGYSHKDLSEFNDHLKHILEKVPESHHLSLTMNFARNFPIEYSEKLRDKHKVNFRAGAIIFPNRDSLSSYLNDETAKSVREPESKPKDVTSTDIRAALGKNKPMNMTTAEWNFHRTIGDSFKHTKLNKFILEIINPIGSNRPPNDPKKPKPKIPPITPPSREEPVDKFIPGQTPPPQTGTYSKRKKN
jgi:hypothetical protein